MSRSRVECTFVFFESGLNEKEKRLKGFSLNENKRKIMKREICPFWYLLLPVTYTTQLGKKIMDEDSVNNILIYCSL